MDIGIHGTVLPSGFAAFDGDAPGSETGPGRGEPVTPMSGHPARP